jgi:YVTN family beta-propeller protein
MWRPIGSTSWSKGRTDVRRLVICGAVLALALPVLAGAAEKQPVYVGARACATCHEGKVAGNQYSHWLLSKHAHAFAVLSTPEGKAMAQLSGILDDPEKAPICLGCHATAADAEPWEKDKDFDLRDGVQCEKCHGPGSEYMSPEVMRDPEASHKAGLRKFTKKDCQLCHYVKGSHVAVHKLPQIDIDKAWETLSHKIPAESRGKDWPSPPEPKLAPAPASGPKYVGSTACESCHRGAAMGHQASLWRVSRHAHAYAALSTSEAEEIARKEGIAGDPQAAPACLQCHATGGGAIAGAPTFSYREGVGCEACHGPGSQYMAEPVMRDRVNARREGLVTDPAAACASCHAKAHGKPFDAKAAFARIAHPTRPAPSGGDPKKAAGDPATPDLLGLGLSVQYKTPLNVAVAPGGRELWVTCEASGTVIVVDVATRLKVAEIRSGGQPADVTFSPDGKRAYVSNRLDDSVSVIDTATRKLVHTIPVGDEPHGLLTDRSGKTLYVLNTSSDDISVVDTGTFAEVKRLSASRYPWSLALSPDGSRLVVTNALSRFVKFRTPPVSEATVIDTAGAKVVDRVALKEANLLLGAAWHPSGDFALVTLNRTKNLVPMTRLQQGWTITNGIGVVWKDGTADQVLLDEPNLYFADSTDVAFTPDGKLAFVTSAGTDRVAVVDVEKLVSLLKGASREERADVIPNHLGMSARFLVKHITVKNSPRGVTVAPDGRTAYVANSLDDSVSVIDVARLEAVARIDLGGPKVLTKVRWGERLFNSANIAFQRQLSCHTCHPDGHVDGLTYDIEADGIGVSPVDNRTLRGIYDTDPFKWEGTNVTLARQCGPRLAVFFTRIQPFAPDELSALNDYTVTIPRPPNRHRPLGAPLTPAQSRGKLIFQRARTSDGREIPAGLRCITCHFPPYFTDRQRHDVGTQQALDRQGSFDVPHLNNIYDSAPYLHNGIADTLEEIWTRYNPYDKHGVTNDMTKDQLNDLIEYLKTL